MRRRIRIQNWDKKIAREEWIAKCDEKREETRSGIPRIPVSTWVLVLPRRRIEKAPGKRNLLFSISGLTS